MRVMEFGEAPPGLLTLTQTTPVKRFTGYWKVAASNHGYHRLQVARWIDDALGDARGWMAAGIDFRQSAMAPVTFQVVEEANCPGEADLGCTEHFDNLTALVTLEASRYGKMKLVNHEAAHAFFFATHTGNGVMNTPGEPDLEWPTLDDLESLAAHLGTTVGVDGADNPGKEPLYTFLASFGGWPPAADGGADA